MCIRDSEHIQPLASQSGTNKGWDGTFEDLEMGLEDVVDGVGGYFIQFINLGLWDSFDTNIDSWIYVDSRGGHKTLGYYTGGKYDLGAVYNATLSTQRVYTSTVVTGLDFMDSWTEEPTSEGSVDRRPSWDGSTEGASVTTQVRTTQLDPASANDTSDWTDYESFTNSSIKARGFQIKAKVESHVPTGSLGGVQFKWYKLTTNFDLFERDELGQKASTPSSNAFTYADQFYNAPTLVITPMNQSSGDYFQVTNATNTGATVKFYDSSNNQVSRNYSFLARGY